MRQVIVGVDGSEGAAHALRWAVSEASIRDAEVVAVLAWGHGYWDLDDPIDPDDGGAEASAALDAMVDAALPLGAARRVRRRTVHDRAVPALLEAARDRELLVVGARGLGGFRGLLLGSVSQRCLHRSTVTTVVVRDTPPQPTGRVVVGIDASSEADAALLWALEEARLRGSSLTVVHAYPPAVAGGPFAVARIDQRHLDESARRAVRAAVARIDAGPVDVTPLAVCGSAAGAVIDAGDAADLIVVGAPRQHAEHPVALGTVATQVIHHARAPVAVVPLPSR